MTGLLHDIARAMNGKVVGDRAIFPTPGHSARDRGSWATIKAGAPDGVLIHSENGGNALEIKDMLREKGVLQPRGTPKEVFRWRPPHREAQAAPNHAVRLQAGQRIVATFEYYDADGALLHRNHRIEPGEDGQTKTFRFDRPDGKGGWISGQGEDRVPYRLPDILAAPHDAPIFMAEGEAKADRLAEWGLLATSHKQWKGFDFSGYVKGRTVFILPDNDETGRKQAKNAFEAVERAGGTPHLLDLPGLPDKGDILDWTGSADDLKRLVDDADAGDELPTLDLVALSRAQPEPKAFAIEQLAPVGEVTLFTGPGSAGKSLFAQQAVTCSAAAIQCLRLAVDPGPAVYVTCEDDPAQLHWRQAHICNALGAPMAALAGTLHLVSLRGALDSELCTFASDGKLTVAPAYHRLVRLILRTGARLVFLDNVAHLFTGNENDRGEVTRFVNLLNRLAGETGAAIVLLGHPNKSGDNYSGSTAWLNAVRSHFTIEHDPETDIRTLTVSKANYARKGRAIRFIWDNWAFVHEDELSPDRAKEYGDLIRANGDNACFKACLAERTRQKRAVSEKSSKTYAPIVFASMPESKGIGKLRLEKAMDRLFAIGAIERGELWKGPDRKPVFGLRETISSGAGYPQEMAEMRAGDTVREMLRETRETPPEGAENRAEDAGNTHTVYKYTPGEASRPASPDNEEVGAEA